MSKSSLSNSKSSWFDSSCSKSKLSSLGFAALAAVLCALPAQADSQARIVRLSDVQGSVQIDKNTGMGFESAFLNLPITQGTQVKTRANGRAEIEFEDGSSMRIAPNTMVQFSTLSLTDSGKRVSVINLVDGMAYFNWLGKGSDDLTLNFSREKVQLDHAAHFRVETSPALAKFAVFKGDVAIDGPSDKVTVGKNSVGKNKMAEFDASHDDKSTLAKDFQEGPLDSWDKESIAYHDQYSKNNASPYGYGASDLNYYGSFSNIAGYGMMWQPFFAGTGWDPFMDGAWSWAPGMGYGFVSAYPWGWMPYHYCNWAFIPGFGWMWQSSCANYANFSILPRVTGTLPAHFTVPVTPTTGAAKTVIVGKGGPVFSSASSSHLILRSGSAGMGVARGSVANLSHLNHQVAKSGVAEVRPSPQFGATSSVTRSSAFSGSSSAISSASRSASVAPAHSSMGSSTGHHN